MPTAPPQAVPQPSHVSYSQLTTLRICGWQYKLERVDQVPSRPSVGAVAGQAIHYGTEYWDRNPGDGRIAAIEAALANLNERVQHLDDKGWTVDQYRSFGRKTRDKPNGEDLQWFRMVGIPKAINAYVDWRENSGFEIAVTPNGEQAIELGFEYDLDGRTIKGYIDRVLTLPNTDGVDAYFPMDIKSGNKPKSDEQIGLYADALRQLFGWEVHWGYYLWNLKNGEARLTDPLHVGAWTADELKRVYRPAIQAIDQGLFIPHPGDACRYMCGVAESCDFRRSAL